MLHVGTLSTPSGLVWSDIYRDGWVTTRCSPELELQDIHSEDVDRHRHMPAVYCTLVVVHRMRFFGKQIILTSSSTCGIVTVVLVVHNPNCNAFADMKESVMLLCGARCCGISSFSACTLLSKFLSLGSPCRRGACFLHLIQWSMVVFVDHGASRWILSHYVAFSVAR